MKLSWHFQVMSDGLGKVFRDFSFSSQASKLSLKAAAATCLSVFLALLLNFQDPFFAGFGCFLMLLPNSGAVYTRAVQSTKGAIFGGFLGYFILGMSINDHFAFTIAIFLATAFFSYIMSVRKSTSFFWYYALVNLLLAALAGAIDPANALDAAFFRVVNVTLGIFCYFLVAVMIFPDFAEDSFLKKLEDTHSSIFRCVSDVLRQYFSGKYLESDTCAKIVSIEKKLSDMGDQIDDLKTEERILGASKFHYDIRLRNLRNITASIREFYEISILEEHRKCCFQKNFADFFENVIAVVDSASDFKYDHEHPYAGKLSPLLANFDSGKEKEIYFGKASEYETEDILLMLESLHFCKSLVQEEHTLPDAGKVNTGNPRVKEEPAWEDDDSVSFGLFGRKFFSIDLMVAKFSLKCALAVIADFWIYFWFEIPGSATAVAISAITVTRPDIILTRHRIMLRMTGCLAGVLCAFIFLAFGVQTTIVMFAWLFIMGYFSGLIWCGEVGIAYIGFQALIAYMISVIPDLAPANDVTEPVQRAVAIVIGVLVAWLVMSFVYPDNLSRIFYSRLKKRRDSLKGDLLAIADRFMSRGGKETTASANFAIEDYNCLFSLLLTIKGHMEMDSDDVGAARLFIEDCISIHRELESISGIGRDVIKYVSGIDPDLGDGILSFASDAITPENDLDASELEKRAAELSCKISQLIKTQREKKLLYGKEMDFKVMVAHLLLSFVRITDYSKTIIPLRSKIRFQSS